MQEPGALSTQSPERMGRLAGFFPAADSHCSLSSEMKQGEGKMIFQVQQEGW